MNKTIKVPPLLIKVGKTEYLQQLQSLGQLYFGTFEGYRKQEVEEIHTTIINEKENLKNLKSELFRNDPLEGLEKRYSGNGSIKLKCIDNQDITINIPDMKLNIFQNKYKHLYCLYALPEFMSIDFKIDLKLLQFGESALVITRPLEFLKRLNNRIRLNYDIDYVTYYDQNNIEDGYYNIFQKSNHFAYQNEFRIATNLTQDNSVYIGDISDISMLVDSKSLLEIEYLIKY